MGNACKKVVADTLIHAPFVYLPTFYVSTGLMQGKSLMDSIALFRAKFRETMAAYVVIWPFTMLGIFYVVPEPSRVLVLACLCFFEKALYSSIQQGKGPSSSASAARDCDLIETCTTTPLLA